MDSNVFKNKYKILFICLIFILLIVFIFASLNIKVDKLEVNKYDVESVNFYSSIEGNDKYGLFENDTLILGIIKNEREKEVLEGEIGFDIYRSLSFDKYNYLLISLNHNSCGENIDFENIDIEGNKYIVNFKDKISCGVCAPEVTIYLIPVSKDITESDLFNVNIDYKKIENCNNMVEKKPILYLYPEEDTNVNVKFEKPELLINTYPKFVNEWDVTVLKDGTIIDKNNNKYYGLYWNEKFNINEDFKTGFYVKSSDSIKFLENKLDEMGFNYKEKNEFIMYWLPVMENNGDNLVHFYFTNERNKQNNLIINPNPDSLFRMCIVIKKVNKYVDIKEQSIEKFDRTGFSALEWGGIVIES